MIISLVKKTFWHRYYFPRQRDKKCSHVSYRNLLFASAENEKIINRQKTSMLMDSTLAKHSVISKAIHGKLQLELISLMVGNANRAKPDSLLTIFYGCKDQEV